MDQIWWKQIPKANRVINNLTDTLLNNQNVSLSVPATMPWWKTMHDLVEDKLNIANPRNRLETFDCPNEDPGEYLFFNYCKKEKRATYRKGISYATFLARSDDLVMNNCYLWVRNVRGEKLDQWIQFITEYNENLPSNLSPALFLLEIPEDEGNWQKIKYMKQVVFSESVDEYDYFAFCALASTDLAIAPALRTYLAELCATICGQDVELCASCIKRGLQFLESPEEILQTIVHDEVRSAGISFDTSFSNDSLRELIWKSQIRSLFPILQQYRSTLVRRHYMEVQNSLPITNSYDEVIDNPQDVELGLLIVLADRNYLSLNNEEYDLLKLFRDARNSLAHMKPVKFAVANKILLAKF